MFPLSTKKGIEIDKVNRYFLTPPKAEPFGKCIKKRANFTCFTCGQPKADSEFFRIPFEEWGFLDEQGRRRVCICPSCIFYMWRHYTEVFDDQYKAWYRVCNIIGIRYDDVLARKIANEKFIWEETKEPLPKEVPWPYVYVQTLMLDKEKAFSLTEDFAFDHVLKVQNTSEGHVYKMTEKDKKARMKVMSIYHWDPFEEDPLEDKPRLYEDLLTISTEGIQEDLTKARAAIEIVRGYSRIDKINKGLRELRLSPVASVENEKSIKVLTDQLRAETSMISTLSKENGFSEATNKMKSKGIGTLTGIVQEMNEKGFDRGIVNKFDIDTVEAMQKVADISAQSMFKQLQWTSADYADMVREQAQMIRRMQKTMAEQSEELRLLKEEHLREELVERYKQSLIDKDLDPAEIERLVQEELAFVPIIEYKNKMSHIKDSSKEKEE